MYTEIQHVIFHVWHNFKYYRLYLEANFVPTEQVVSRGKASEFNTAFVGCE